MAKIRKLGAPANNVTMWQIPKREPEPKGCKHWYLYLEKKANSIEDRVYTCGRCEKSVRARTKKEAKELMKE